MDTIKKIWFKGNRIYMETNNDETYSRALEAFPILKEATLQQRNDFSIGKDKMDIRWEELDEDIHINSFFDHTEPYYNNTVTISLQQFPQINIYALANQIGINKSLLAQYIYGIKKPSSARKKEIENALHAPGKQLLAVDL
ncbi:MAG: DUF2442 domain-containing protein [Ginsengibacter sp.]